jgi:hypothetical protein
MSDKRGSDPIGSTAAASDEPPAVSGIRMEMVVGVGCAVVAIVLAVVLAVHARPHPLVPTKTSGMGCAYLKAVPPGVIKTAASSTATTGRCG